jgi:hypothetical protein
MAPQPEKKPRLRPLRPGEEAGAPATGGGRVRPVQSNDAQPPSAGAPSSFIPPQRPAAPAPTVQVPNFLPAAPQSAVIPTQEAAARFDPNRATPWEITGLRNFGPRDMATATVDGLFVNTLGAPVDLMALAMNLAGELAEAGVNTGAWAGEQMGWLPDDTGRLEIPDIQNPTLGSQYLKDAWRGAVEATGGDVPSKWELTPTGRLGYDVTENTAAAIPMSRAAVSGVQRATTGAMDYAKQVAGHAKSPAVATGRDFAQDMAAGAGAGVGVNAAEQGDPEADPLGAAVLALGGGLGGSMAASLAQKPAEVVTSLKRSVMPDTSIQPPTGLLDLAGDQRRRTLLEETPTEAIVDEAAAILQQSAVNPRAAAATLEERAADARTLGDVLPDSYSVSNDEGLIGLGSAIRTGAMNEAEGTAQQAVLAAKDRRVADAVRSDIESLRVPGADQRAPQRLIEDDKLAIETSRQAALKAAQDAADDATRRAQTEGAVLQSMKGRDAEASEEADRIVAAALRRDQKKRSELYDLGDKGLEGVDATGLRSTWDDMIAEHVNSVDSVRSNMVPPSVRDDLRDLFPDEDELGDVPPPRGSEPTIPASADGFDPSAILSAYDANPQAILQALRNEGISNPQGYIDQLRRKVSPSRSGAPADVLPFPTDRARPPNPGAADGGNVVPFAKPGDPKPASHKPAATKTPPAADGDEADLLAAFNREVDADPDALKGAYDDIDGIEPGQPVVTLKQLQQVRQNMSKEERAAREAGDFALVDRIRKLKQSVDEVIDNHIATSNSPGAKQLAKAKQFDQDEFDVWLHGTADEYRQRFNKSPDRRDGSPPSATLGYFLKSGIKGAKEASADLQAIRDRVAEPVQLRDAVRKYFMASAARVVDQNGVINEKALRRWRNDHKSALEEWPEINDEFKKLANSAGVSSREIKRTQDDLRAARASYDATEKEIREMALYPFLDTEPKKAAAAILNGRDPEVQMDAVLRRIGKNQAARDGLKDAISEHLYDLVTGTNAAAGSEGVAVSASKMLNQMRRHKKVLAKIYTPQEMAVLDRAERTLRDLQATSVRAGRGSDTGDRFANVKTNMEMFFRLKSGHLAGASEYRAFKMILDRIPGINNDDKVSRLLLMAAFDPELAAMLLKRPPRPEGMKLFATKMSGRLALISGAQEQVDDDDQEMRSGGFPEAVIQTRKTKPEESEDGG